MRMSGNTALVTAAAGGIGAASAKLFASEGAQVVVCDIDFLGAKNVAKKICDEGGKAIAVKLDVTDEAAWIECFDEALDRFDRIDTVMNNAGLIENLTIEETTVDIFDRLCSVNLKGVFLGCKIAIGHMKQRSPDLPFASIINVSSTAGFVGTARTGIYTMTKGGVRLFTKSVAVEVAELGYNIRCNSLHPGATETPMYDDILVSRNITKSEFRELAKTRNPLGRMAQPYEIANGALFLASNDSSFMTGTELALDGGYAAR